MKKYFYITSMLIFNTFVLSAQIEKSISDFQFSKLEDKVILITDKDLYLSGEQLWFSAFYLQNGKLSNKEFSKVLYVELFNAKNDIIWQGKFSIEHYQASGKIELPSEIISGTYYLRSYTQLQKNNVAESFFTKAVIIINPSVPLPAVNLTDEEIIISAGNGKLINETENFIAINLRRGLISRLNSFWISDQYNNKVATPVLFKNGLGYVYLTPKDTLQYTLKLAFADGDTLGKELPPQSGTEIALNAKMHDNELAINIIDSEKRPVDQNSKYHIRIVSNGNKELIDTIFSSKEIRFNGSNFENKLYLCELVDSQGQIVAQQYFIGLGRKKIQLQVKTDKEVYGNREKVELNIGNDFQNIVPVVSIAVTEKITDIHSFKILPGYLVYNPFLIPFYLETNPVTDSLALKQLDIICQLNSFPFKNMFTGTESSISWPPETSDVNITALLRNKKSKEPVSGRTVFVSVLGDEAQLHVNKTKDDGKVYFSLTHSTDTKDIYLTAESNEDEDIELLVLNDFSGEFPKYSEVPLEIDTTFKKLLEENWKTQQIENQYKVLEKFRSEKILPPTSRFGNPDYHVETKDFIELTNVEELFKEIIPYTRLKKKAGEYYFEVMDPAKNALYNNPLILLDDVPIFNYSGLASIPFSLIESVDVYNKQYVYGDFVFNGIVLIKTKTDNFAGLFMPFGSVFAVYQTITPEVILQFPQYPTLEIQQSSLPDFRSLLFWNPDVKLSGKRNNFSFYISDYSTEYDVIVRGVTDDGTPCYGSANFKVSSRKQE